MYVAFSQSGESKKEKRDFHQLFCTYENKHSQVSSNGGLSI
jgi:hypothetical protein